MKRTKMEQRFIDKKKNKNQQPFTYEMALKHIESLRDGSYDGIKHKVMTFGFDSEEEYNSRLLNVDEIMKGPDIKLLSEFDF